jgi:hypothetical protein
MTDAPTKRFPFAKIVVGMALCLLLGIGLCGLDIFLGSHGYGKTGGEFSAGPIDNLSLAVMVLSAIGLVLSLAAWILAAIFGALTSQGPESVVPPAPTVDQETKRDKEE